MFRSTLCYLGVGLQLLCAFLALTLPCCSSKSSSIRAAPSDESAGIARPRLVVDTSALDTSKYKQLNVANGADLQSAINAAPCGSVLSLEARAKWTGTFVLPNKGCDAQHWVVIRTSTPDSSVPVDARVDPSKAPLMPSLQAGAGQSYVVRFAEGAGYYRLIGLEVTTTSPNRNLELIQIGSGVETSEATYRHHIVIDRCYVHGLTDGENHRGISFAGNFVAVVNSFISEIHGGDYEAQGIAAWQGNGPFKIANNYISASSQAILFGGSDTQINGNVPSDIEIVRNYMTRPLSWYPADPSYVGNHWMVKNILELKNARRVAVIANVMEHNWPDAQNGFSVLLTPRNQDGGNPWATVEDVTFEYNVLRHACSGFNIAGADNKNGRSAPTHRVQLRHNLLQDIDATWGGATCGVAHTSYATANGAPYDIRIEHNTWISSNKALFADTATEKRRGYVYRDNIFNRGEWGGFMGSGTGEGDDTIAAYFSDDFVYTHNLLENCAGECVTRTPYGWGKHNDGNWFVADWSDLPTNDPGNCVRASGDLSACALAEASRYHRAATDGTDVGANISELAAAIAGVAQ